MSDARSISTVAVLGGGTMGHGIAHVCAVAGYRTHLFDVAASQAERAQSRIAQNLAKGVEKGKIAAEQVSAALDRLTTGSDLASAVGQADLVLEAIPEILEAKQQLLAQTEALCPSDAILGTNTSSLSIAAIASALDRPERVIGTHFFNPVHLMKLLEIVVGPQTSPEVLAAVQRLGVSLGKECIVVKDSPGFATSRLGLVIGLEAIRMLEEGVASAEDIDKAMTLGYGFPMGPLRLTDLVGLDVRLHIAEALSTNLPRGGHFQPPELLRRMVSEGKLGQKSGQGFYRWGEGG